MAPSPIAVAASHVLRPRSVHPTDSSISPGAIVVVVLGSIALIALCCVACLVGKRTRRREGVGCQQQALDEEQARGKGLLMNEFDEEADNERPPPMSQNGTTFASPLGTEYAPCQTSADPSGPPGITFTAPSDYPRPVSRLASTTDGGTTPPPARSFSVHLPLNFEDEISDYRIALDSEEAHQSDERSTSHMTPSSNPRPTSLRTRSEPRLSSSDFNNRALLDGKLLPAPPISRYTPTTVAPNSSVQPLTSPSPPSLTAQSPAKVVIPTALIPERFREHPSPVTLGRDGRRVSDTALDSRDSPRRSSTSLQPPRFLPRSASTSYVAPLVTFSAPRRPSLSTPLQTAYAAHPPLQRPSSRRQSRSGSQRLSLSPSVGPWSPSSAHSMPTSLLASPDTSPLSAFSSAASTLTGRAVALIKPRGSIGSSYARVSTDWTTTPVSPLRYQSTSYPMTPDDVGAGLRTERASVGYEWRKTSAGSESGPDAYHHERKTSLPLPKSTYGERRWLRDSRASVSVSAAGPDLTRSISGSMSATGSSSNASSASRWTGKNSVDWKRAAEEWNLRDAAERRRSSAEEPVRRREEDGDGNDDRGRMDGKAEECMKEKSVGNAIIDMDNHGFG